MIPSWINRWLPEKENRRAAVFAIASFLAGTLASPFFGFVISGTLASLTERATFPMLEARIEVARHAGAAIPCDGRVLAYAPVIAEILQWNLRIAHEQESNHHWISDYFSTDRWNAIRPIPIPCQKELDNP